ncbi:putative transcription regulator A20-like family [Helianthus annuus]|nr:putative transcription regulator A20-like family [Helianthus annuus]KAJ0552757.1 putative transcription regulator A20-like family [Helianthus annuus]KAJ0718438.1 putative transcription regulator A20-like family [Helianthus annuus]KAJ0896928.1 putative transcription regulator A20-like family [Helianthus annuus]
MAEEHKCQQPSTHVLCANNCGFFGSPTTLNLCSKCYKDHCLKDHHISTAKIALTRQPESSSSSRAAVADAAGVPNLVSPDQSLPNLTTTDLTVPTVLVTDAKPEQRNRCGCCRKRVGLTGFTCKCGMVFCGTHRYPEKHECSFDFKTVGKEAIARENPVVKGVKLEKI